MRDEMETLSRAGVMLGVLVAAARRAARSMVVAGTVLALSGCGADADFAPEGDVEALGEAEGPQFRRISQDITGGWVSLVPILRNGWVAAADSNTPEVGIVDGIVTFRGALNGQNATSNVAFCLNAPTYTGFRQSDGALVTVPAALANGASGALTFDVPLVPVPVLNQYCMSIREYNAATQPGANARALTSLEGVSFDKAVSSSSLLAQPPFSTYPHRGSDGTAHPNGIGLYGKKLANNFVRFQGVTDDSTLLPVLFTVPSNMRPGNPVFVPVTLCPQDSTLSQAGRIQIKTNGQVVVEGLAAAVSCGVSLDGSSYSLASSAGASAISLSNNWVAYSNRAVRVRDSGGVVRLEGAVKSGTSTTIGTLPVGKRPAKTIYVVANLIMLPGLRSVLSIDSSGLIKVISPPLAGAQPGLSLDGVSFGI